MTRIPTHVAIIMDGNGRWAEQRGLPRLAGHRQGARTVRTIVEAACRIGLRHLTLYTFSVDNWKRPAEEVNGLLDLVGETVRDYAAELIANGVRVHVIGDLDDLPQRVREPVDWLIEASSGNRTMDLHMALNYGGRSDLVRAVRHIAQQVACGQIVPEEIDEALLRGMLSTGLVPDPDLIIRTGGEKRLSDFLIYEAAYAEFYFCDVLWPDFSVADLNQALLDYGRRERRFGRTSEQVRGQAELSNAA
ncbi:MAG: polyprenyl diphosphate synthase [Myxococcales bacterium]|nr:polyprenyl diphosphate synthase [Myxococcota bacterium]MDW8282741.1 polyprenyl diphosphate synthase [Myxococcales bacterium]